MDLEAQASRIASLSRVAASIAHEFNNVLMGIQPNVEVLRRRAGAELATPIEHILRSVERGKRITDAILRFTRPAALAPRRVHVAQFLAAWQNEIRPALGPRIDLRIEAAPDLHMTVDPRLIAQVLTNLAVNACDAMNDGGTLAISVATTPERFVHLRVADTGAGMTSDQLARLFEPLFTTKKGGTGLGLAAGYQIVSQHGGTISAESEPGQGTTFHLFLPAMTSVADAGSPAKLPSSARIVIVEDEEAVSSGLSALLEMEGMRTHVVDTGRAAVPAIEHFTPDAVILDIGLPDVSGTEVYVHIAERWPALPVLFSSGHAGDATIETHLAKPNVGLIVKPYDLTALRGSLAAVLRS